MARRTRLLVLWVQGWLIEWKARRLLPDLRTACLRQETAGQRRFLEAARDAGLAR